MTFKMPSNRKLHPQNGKVVNTAIETIKTTAAISQEKYWNAFRVNGYTCSVYNLLTQGKLCSCSAGTKTDVMKPILDEDGNAPKEFINSMLNGGLLNGSFDYGENFTQPQTRKSTKILELDTGTQPSTTHFSNEFDTPNANFIEEDYDDEFLIGELGNTSTSKCGICYGSGYVGGFNLCFGNRIIIDSTHKDTNNYAYSVQQENLPNSFISHAPDAYIEFKVTLPKYILQINAFDLKYNSVDVEGKIQASNDGVMFTDVTISNLKNFCTGLPTILRVSDVETFTHIELEFNLSDQTTYLEYPIISKTGDVTILDAIGDVVIYVSPLISEISPKDIIVDNTLGKIWRVVSVNDHKDRNYNIHGWEVNARLVQSYEMYVNLPRSKTIQRQLTTRLNRW